jgi:Amt family ammonium transporter
MTEFGLVEVWVLFCTAIAFFMQAGFCCYEAGLSRSKNSIDVACKNLVDFCVVGAIFWMVGFGLMFGETSRALIGTTGFLFSDTSQEHWPTIFFLFQLVYCGTSITIVSGAVAERMRFIAYVLVAVLVGLVIYPVFGQWAWDGLGSEGPGGNPKLVGWLGARGFVDFAGSTVVHSLGGWAALASVVVVGARLDKFHNRRPRRMQGHSLPLGALGLFILWFGWFGLTGGRTFAPNSDVPVILVNTLLGGVAGGIGGLGFSLVAQQPRMRRLLKPLKRKLARYDIDDNRSELPHELSEAKFSLEHTMNGVIAGLVAISASCNLVAHPSALLIGLSAALVMHVGGWMLEHAFGIDDVVGAIPAHLFAGVWGTMCVAWFAPLEHLHGMSRLGSTGVQFLGVFACGVWSFPLSLGFLKLVGWLSGRFPFFKLRPSPEEEEKGLNIIEHGASTEYDLLVRQMFAHLSGDRVHKLPVEEFTEMKLMAEVWNQVADAQSALQASRAQEEFLASMSHEIRTPMTSILGYADLLYDKLQSEEDKENAATIIEQGQHLKQLIDDILDLSKIEAGKLRVEHKLFSPAGLIDEVIELMSVQSRKKGLRLETGQVGMIPEVITSDKGRVKQILINLIGNAIKFTEAPGSVRLVTRLLKDTDSAMLRFDVIDTGIGMNEVGITRLFRPFTQADTTIGGTGLGLTISKRLVEKLGGDIEVISAPDEGSTFAVTIPCGSLEGVNMISDLAATTGKERRLDADDRRQEQPTCQRRILLVEDLADNQRLITHLLQRAGADVTPANNGLEGIELALNAWADGRPFDLVLMDMRMPVMDGYEAVRHLRTAGYRLPIVALTAHAMSHDRDKCMAAGCDDFVTKPLPRDLIKQLLTSLDEPRGDVKCPAKLYSTEADDPHMADILAQFVGNVPEHAAALRSFCRDQRWDELEGRAHDLKGVVGMYGFHHVTPVAKTLLQAVRENKPTEEISAACDALVDVLGRLAAGVSPNKSTVTAP